MVETIIISDRQLTFTSPQRAFTYLKSRYQTQPRKSHLQRGVFHILNQLAVKSSFRDSFPLWRPALTKLISSLPASRRDHARLLQSLQYFQYRWGTELRLYVEENAISNSEYLLTRIGPKLRMVYRCKSLTKKTASTQWNRPWSVISTQKLQEPQMTTTKQCLKVTFRIHHLVHCRYPHPRHFKAGRNVRSMTKKAQPPVIETRRKAKTVHSMTAMQKNQPEIRKRQVTVPTSESSNTFTRKKTISWRDSGAVKKRKQRYEKGYKNLRYFRLYFDKFSCYNLPFAGFWLITLLFVSSGFIHRSTPRRWHHQQQRKPCASILNL